MRARRYQLNKDAVAIIQRGHPWIFREQLSSAASVFADGDWLRLVDGTNQVVAHGIYESEGAIAIRIVRRGPDRPDAAWVRSQLDVALARRVTLPSRTDAIRLVHGESDGLPAVVVDRFADTLVATSYSRGTDALVHHIALVLADAAHATTSSETDRFAVPPPVLARITGEHRIIAAAPAESSGIPVIESPPAAVIGPAEHVVVRPSQRRRAAPQPLRVLRGSPTPTVAIVEDDIEYVVDLAEGQKTGTYLDLRGLRHAITTAPLAGARVLNLFAYSGMLGRAAELAGAAHVTQVDISKTALAFAEARHVVDPQKHTFVIADVFDWLPALSHDATFDLVIVDPPSMTSKQAQVKGVLAAYRKLYRAAAPHVRPGGALIAACCTSRIERAMFHRVVREALGEDFTMERELPPEIDHPVGFPQADYLKIGWWRRARPPH